MNRTHLTGAIQTLASGLGYTVYADSDDRTPQAITLLPAAWLQPIRLKMAEGRRHGRLTYSVELRLLLPGMKLPCNDRHRTWSRAEEHLLGLFAELSRDAKVLAVENLAIHPGSGIYTPYGELSQTAKADIITLF